MQGLVTSDFGLDGGFRRALRLPNRFQLASHESALIWQKSEAYRNSMLEQECLLE